MTQNESASIAVLQEQAKVTKDTLERIEQKIDNLDKKFAARWVQTVVGGLVAAILLAFVGVLITFFIPNKTDLAPEVNTPSNTGSNTPQSVEANAAAQATSDKPQDSQTSSSSVTEVLDSALKGL